MRETRQEIENRIIKALNRPKSITDLHKELGKEEKIIRVCLQEISDKVTFTTQTTSRGESKIYSLKSNPIIQDNVTTNKKQNEQDDDEYFGLCDLDTTDKLKEKFLSEDELEILNYGYNDTGDW
jgi:hypothetical protein